MEEVSKYQKFETATINRGQIKNAEYNPEKPGYLSVSDAS